MPVTQQPMLAPGPQIGHPLPQPRVPTPKASQNRPISGTAGLAKRLSSVLSSTQSAESEPAHSGPRDGPSIAAAAFKYAGSTQPDAASASGISLMGSQLAAAERRINRSSVLNRSRTQGLSNMMAESALLLIQAVARNDSDTVNLMLQQGLGSIDDTDSSGNSTLPPRPQQPCPRTIPNPLPLAPQPCATSPA